MKFELNLPSDFDEKTAEFGKILAQFNAVHNLTKYENLRDLIEDSIFALKFCEFSGKNIIDVGSGAGIPAIFLAIARSGARFHLFEPLAKKYSFLVYVKEKLNLQNIKIYGQKIENTTPFIADIITSRAVMKTQNLLKICEKFYNDKTQFILYKGSGANDEISTLNCQSKIINGKNHRKYILIKDIK